MRTMSSAAKTGGWLLLLFGLSLSYPVLAASPPAEPVFLEVQAEPSNPYVQSQVIYTARLFYTALLLEGSLDAPDPPHASIERLGEDSAYDLIRNGQRYRVIERRYAIFPEKSGELIIPPIRMHGRVREGADYESSPGRLSLQSRSIQLASQTLSLQVRPRPDNYRGDYWLPATEVSLREEWPGQSSAWRVGEPATWILKIAAKGLSATQLPALLPPESGAVRIYPEQPILATRSDGNGIDAYREQRLAIIPTQAGELTLPEIRLSWWDTRQDKERVAILPARKITVLPAVEPAPALLPSPKMALSSDKLTPLAESVSHLQEIYWPGVSALVFGLWLITLLAWWRARRPRTVPPATPVVHRPSATQARQALHLACRRHDAHAAAVALLELAKAVWPEQPPRNLGELAGRIEGDSHAVRELDRVLYAASIESWRGEALWAAVRKGLLEQRPAASAPDEVLPPLYPRAPRAL